MKTLTATILASALCASFAYASDKTDPTQYRSAVDKAAADYKSAIANCASMSGNAKTTCIDEAKVTQAKADVDAVTQFDNTPKQRSAAHIKLADAEYALAKSKCGDMTGNDKTNCLNNAKSTHLAALSDAKAERHTAMAERQTTVAERAGTESAKQAAMDKCAQNGGNDRTGCLIDNRATTPTVGQKAETVAANAAEKTREAADTVATKSEHLADKTGDAMSDSVITTKVKADIFKEPELKSMAIHVETDKGVVHLSGFVDSKADAEKAASIAGSVQGVTQVKSALKVK